MNICIIAQRRRYIQALSFWMRFQQIGHCWYYGIVKEHLEDHEDILMHYFCSVMQCLLWCQWIVAVLVNIPCNLFDTMNVCTADIGEVIVGIFVGVFVGIDVAVLLYYHF